jgi:Bacteriophage related domain of unknown function
MPIKAVADAVEARLAANWTATVIIAYDTMANPPDLDAFLVHHYPVVNSVKPVLSRVYWEEGGIRFVLNVRRGIGVAQALAWCDELSALFRGVKFSGVECFEPSGPPLDDNSEEGDWISYPVIVPYRFEFLSPLIP